MLQLAGDLVVLAERRRRPVPRAPIRVLLGVEHGRQRPVDGLTLRERGIAVEGRTDERMAKLDAAAKCAHESCDLRRLECLRFDAERRGRPGDRREAAGVVGRDEQQQSLRRRRQAARTL